MCKCIYGFFMHLQNHDVKLKSYYLIVLNVWLQGERIKFLLCELINLYVNEEITDLLMYKDETIEIVFSHLLDVGIQCIRLTSKLSFLYLYVIFLFTEHGQLTQFSLQLIKIIRHTHSNYMYITFKDITLACI